MPDRSWVLIAHGGAKSIEPEDESNNRNGLMQALAKGCDILSGGGTALDAAEAVVQILESDPTFNAGLYGSVTNEDGEVEMDASIMDGATLDIGAVAGIQNIKHPVAVARALLKEKAILLVGQGAQKFAQENGFLSEEQRPADIKDSTGCDTVGCVARDAQGSLAVATSTGGLKGAKVGRG